MSNDTFEGWAYKLSDVADHTYVKCPNHGTFVCWGGSSGPDNRKINSGSGDNYNVANCYRKPAFDHQDTAGIVYGVNGVCHQKANLFMYPARTTLTWSVRGYWASTLTYGVYGASSPANPGLFFPTWLLAVYNPCYQSNKSTMMAASNDSGDSGLVSAIEKIYADRPLTSQSNINTESNNLLQAEAKIVLDYSGVEVDYAEISRVHGEFLAEKTSLTEADSDTVTLAEKINANAMALQSQLESTIGSDAYSRLMGVDAGVRLGVVNPEIAAAVDAARKSK